MLGKSLKPNIVNMMDNRHWLYLHRFQCLQKLSFVEKKLARSCRQIILLNDAIKGLTCRYYKARADGYKGFRYNLRVRIATVEGVRNMFYEYARFKAEEVADMRKELFNENVVIVTGSGVHDADQDTSSDDDFDLDDDDFENDYVDHGDEQTRGGIPV